MLKVETPNGAIVKLTCEDVFCSSFDIGWTVSEKVFSRFIISTLTQFGLVIRPIVWDVYFNGSDLLTYPLLDITSDRCSFQIAEVSADSKIYFSNVFCSSEESRRRLIYWAAGLRKMCLRHLLTVHLLSHYQKFYVCRELQEGLGHLSFKNQKHTLCTRIKSVLKRSFKYRIKTPSKDCIQSRNWNLAISFSVQSTENIL